MEGFEALQEFDRFSRMLDRWLPQEPAVTSGSSSGPGETETDWSQWRDDPVGLALTVFGVHLWTRQSEFLRLVAANPRVACRSGHKCGKTLAIAILAWWFVLTRPEGRVLITAPTDRQVRRLAWREIRRLCRLAKARGYDLPTPALAPDTGIQFDDGREVIGFSTDTPENMAGFSGAEVLVLVDEASGVSKEIFEAIQGNLAGGAIMVLISNPTQSSGQFFDAFHSERDAWALMHMSSEEVARENIGPARVRGLAAQEWIDDRRKSWGVDDPRYQVRVAGNFPIGASNTVVSLGLLESAFNRWGTADPGATLNVGVDVARFGDDDSVVRPVRGLVALPARSAHGYDSTQVAALVKQTIRDHREPNGRVSVRIDASGGYGSGVADLLRTWNEAEELGVFVQIIEVSAAERSSDPTKYDRRRDELWFGIREWLESGGTIDRDAEPEEFEEDLLTPRYSFARASGAIKVESKDEIKKRTGRSPDHGDAFALAVLELDSAPVNEDDLKPVPGAEVSRWADMPGMGF
jgi:phage terminase large subunit